MIEDAPRATTHPRSTWWRSRRTWLATIAIVAVLVASGASLRFYLRPGDGGPLTDPEHTSDSAEGVSKYDLCVEADTDFEWFEMTSLGNSGTVPLTIDGVDVGGTEDVEVVGTLVVPLEKEAGGLPSWGSPPNRAADGPVEDLIEMGVRVDQRKPAVGHQVAQGDRPAILMVGLRPIGNAIGRMNSITVRYHVGRRHYSRYLHHQVTVYRKNPC